MTSMNAQTRPGPFQLYILQKGCHPQHKKQPSASQMDCSCNDFSLLACKGDTSSHIKCVAQPQKQYAAACLDGVSRSRAEHLLIFHRLPNDFLRAGSTVNPWNKKRKCMQAAQQLPFPEI